jgi:hypothetical protein
MSAWGAGHWDSRTRCSPAAQLIGKPQAGSRRQAALPQMPSSRTAASKMRTARVQMPPQMAHRHTDTVPLPAVQKVVTTSIYMRTRLRPSACGSRNQLICRGAHCTNLGGVMLDP